MKRKSNENATVPKAKRPVGNHWTLGLYQAIQDPTLNIKSDDLIDIVKDKYPKAKCHFLIIPKANITDLRALNKSHLSLLRHMEIAAATLVKNTGKKCLIGYHAQASLSPLHLHVISDDFNSACLKTKLHWNSFTTKFFILHKDVIKSIEETGHVALPSTDVCERYKKEELKCHKCEFKPDTIPNLKKHILTH